MSNGTKVATETKGTQATKAAAEQERRSQAEISIAKEVLKNARKGRSPVDPNETPEAKFIRLAQKRMTRALAMIRYVGNLANRRQYTYTDGQSAKIVNTLIDAVATVKQKFAADQKQEDTFKL